MENDEKWKWHEDDLWLAGALTLSYSSPGPSGSFPFILGHPYRMSRVKFCRLVPKGHSCSKAVTCWGKRSNLEKAKTLSRNLKKIQDKNSFAAAAKSLQSCPTLCDPRNGSPPGFPVLGILQARTLEWVAISFSNAWKLKVKVKLLSRVWLFTTPWTAAYQAPPSMGFSRQE